MSALKLNIVVAICSFGLGCLTAQSFTHQPITHQIIPDPRIETVHAPQASHTSIIEDIKAYENSGQLITKTNTEKIKALINQNTQGTINTYLKKAFPQADLSAINDQKKFSERLIDELSNTDQSEPNPTGHLTISSNTLMPRQSENLSEVYKNQEIFAHFDTLGKTPQGTQVFVRWINHDTGEILLFTPTQINAASQQNWISFAPANGWKEGKYDIKYYQMNDALTPIANTSFTISKIIQ